MTELLIRAFIRDYSNTNDNKVRSAYGRLAGLVGIVCNILLFAGKFVVGTLSGSVSITADAFNNLSDASSSLVSLLGFKLGSRPADEEHPYGHARYEYLAGLTVAVMILVIGVELLKSSFVKVLHPEMVDFRWLSIVVLAASVLVKLWLAFFNRKLGKRIHSQTLMATSADSRNDVISTCAVIVAAILSHLLKIELDGFMGIAVALFILYSGLGIIRDTLDPIIGKAPEPEIVEKIRSIIMSYDGVLGTHDLMVHDYGPGRQFASVHVEVAAENDVLESHDMIDNIERRFHEEMDLHLIIHMDPIVTKDEKVLDTRGYLAELVLSIHPDLSVHDLRMVPGNTHTNLIFDCVIPHELDGHEEEVKQRISALVKKDHPDYNCVITVDHSFSVIHHE